MNKDGKKSNIHFELPHNIDILIKKDVCRYKFSPTFLKQLQHFNQIIVSKILLVWREPLKSLFWTTSSKICKRGTKNQLHACLTNNHNNIITADIEQSLQLAKSLKLILKNKIGWRWDSCTHFYTKIEINYTKSFFYRFSETLCARKDQDQSLAHIFELSKHFSKLFFLF